MTAALVLIGGVALACAIVWLGQIVAARIIVALPALGASGAALETTYGVTIFGALLACALAGKRWTRSAAQPLPATSSRSMAIGAAVGAGGLGAAALLAWLAGVMVAGSAEHAAVTLLLLGSALVLLQSASEEIYFRGWMQPVLTRAWGPHVALLATAVGFAVVHLAGGARSPATLVNLVLGGLVFGALAQRGGLAAAICAHFGWNWSEQMLLGLFPNPATGGFGAAIDLDLVGSALWGGAAEGLNASIAESVILLALLPPLLAWHRRSHALPLAAAGTIPGANRHGWLLGEG